MRLKDVAELLITGRLIGDGETELTGIETDSRSISEGQLFICLRGHTVDGHLFAPQAAAAGASALIVERELDLPLPQIIVRDCRLALAVFANLFYGYPSHSLKLIGVTGTNGKTTTTYLIEHILNDQRMSTGVIGTIERRFNGQSFPMTSTTPQSLQLQRYLSEMRDAGSQYCTIEVSSHALEQGRVMGCRFRTAVFTNLTQDHLDYHETMGRYAAAKGLLFSRLGNVYSAEESERSYAVLNADDAISAEYAELTAAEVVTYGIDKEADVRASNIRITAQGTTFHVNTFRGEADVTLQMAGKFNVYNALAAISAVLIEGVELAAIAASLRAIPGVPGRVEAVHAGQAFAVIVDYAHTPDGLENVLRAVRQFAGKRILCVFGCGGDRDRSKRPLMGNIAVKYADYAIITSDNPRTEPPEFILKDIEDGLIKSNIDPSSYELLADRKSAIQKAVEMASPGDVVLIAGKGHETYQDINGVKYPFDDRKVAKEAIRGIIH
ncbi:UDP-N-acetylmuramoyl-L-alanyl-D-glutamate--2,6-diaminopimelate ligase [Paenibacillus sp. Soil522]|uniref:UDP-N-acetylmuramoyl-L-alanyl-D-glutamate--2, 6-diaminopimelate ligase n=1 Tax=Paenibacillus sp. Soil522 TaxID=1736388 RepID=UPI0006FA9888|nr:UDP-N-acetylmuramoyl-L-alanyl-D-glutamate--2,6-diaminopimelate ligase [Paenibacillus sp. Soil522]KRE35161.1 UDP-N-acetylmuramoylalanyl-D-glutamate--2,6-diaminopimelate ligase [Paenibacillus sp. Soil522]